ncbi:MAG: DsrE family protein [Promethearchaeota archaeon]
MNTIINGDKNKQHLILIIKDPPHQGESLFGEFSDLFASLDEEIEPIILYVFNGVWNLLSEQISKNHNFPNIEKIYKSMITKASFYAYKDSLERRGLIGKKLLTGVKILEMKEMVSILREFGDDILFF